MYITIAKQWYFTFKLMVKSTRNEPFINNTGQACRYVATGMTAKNNASHNTANKKIIYH